MNSSRKSRRSRRSKSALRKFKKRVSQFGQWLTSPLKLLFLPAKAVELFHERGVELENRSRRSKRKRQNLVMRILGYPVRLLLLPWSLYHRAKRRRKLKELVYLVPALVIAMLFAFVWYQNTFRFYGMHQKYLARTRQSIESNKLGRARMYFARILQDESLLSNAQALHWAVILDETGDKARANEVLDRIAPDDREGYEPAHRMKVSYLVADHLEEGNPLAHEKLKFHLQHAGELDAVLQRAWAVYFEAIGEHEKAINYLQEASKAYPELNMTTAMIARRSGQENVRLESLGKARFAFEKRLVDEPLDVRTRVELAKCYIELEDFGLAEKTLNEGMAIKATPVLQRSLSNLYLILLDRQASGLKLDQKIAILKRAIGVDPDSEAPYQRLVGLASGYQSTDENDRASFKQQLQAIVANVGSGAIDHCNLAFIHNQDQNVSERDWHLEQAWRIDPDFGGQASRLASAFAKSPDSQNLDWALALARLAASKSPKEADFRETLAEIYLIREEYKQAIAILTSTLQDTDNLAEIHRRLAFAYQNIGETKRASIHHQKSAEAEAN